MKTDWRLISVRFLAALLAMTAPLAFPLAISGYRSLKELFVSLVFPAMSLLVGLCLFLYRTRLEHFSARVARGALAGAIATVALEAVRYPAFLGGWMPGNIPDLMGVLLLDRFALGPSTASTLAGFGYHFLNGAAFGILFAVAPVGRSRWWAIPYGLGIGAGFMVSPVVRALGVGWFGVNFGWHFAATVLTAHAAFGGGLAFLMPKRDSSRAGQPQASSEERVEGARGSAPS